MTRGTQTTIEQWATLQAVVECGGYAQAAERLARSQSAVSYTVARLQERLGCALLEVEGRKAHLTEVGAALLAEAIPLIDDLARLESRGRILSHGEEACVRLSIEAVFPKTWLFDALVAFQKTHGHVLVELRENVRGSIMSQAAEGFDLAITSWEPHERTGRRITDIEMVAVAHRDHPLHQRSGPLSLATLSRHLCVFIQGESVAAALTWEGPHWRVNTVEAAIEAVGRALCFGWLPRHQIASQIAEGTLVPLPLELGASRLIPLVLVYADPDRIGSATRALGELLLSGAPKTR
ncbi:LysR family transcriptional regulator [Telmatospirillum siberiense]|uniref:LysR family transcriptional regulator n=1 Tax=Telmatospirillum siberiense TaxID=382514 RepID=A0A2N3PR66_9PROT|nr:LysR family transcriptional regulator [Telmatospirillum siberiense]PKU22895.1 LysR family transcriptional regulator [Telmatospirillum siberiense]